MRKLLLALLLAPFFGSAQTLKPFTPSTELPTPEAPTPGASESASYVPSIPALDNRNGFRDMKFGSRLSQAQGMTRIGTKEETYKRLSDKLVIGKGLLKSIFYMYHNRILYGVEIHVVGEENSYAVLEALKSEYGDPYQPNEYIPKYHWFGRVAGISFDENSITHNAVIFMFNTELLRTVVADDKEQAKPSKGDL